MDFHTSEKITPICEGFDPETFASTLERAHVNSVTCFAVCHHGIMIPRNSRTWFTPA